MNTQKCLKIFVLALFQQFERVRKVFEHVTNLRQIRQKKEISIEYAIFRFPIFRPKSLTEKVWNCIKLKLQFVLFSSGAEFGTNFRYLN